MGLSVGGVGMLHLAGAAGEQTRSVSIHQEFWKIYQHEWAMVTTAIFYHATCEAMCYLGEMANLCETMKKAWGRIAETIRTKGTIGETSW